MFIIHHYLQQLSNCQNRVLIPTVPLLAKVANLTRVRIDTCCTQLKPEHHKLQSYVDGLRNEQLNSLNSWKYILVQLQLRIWGQLENDFLFFKGTVATFYRWGGQIFPSEQFWQNFVCQCMLPLPTRLATKIVKIWKCTMADGGHLENRKTTISPKVFG